VRAIARGPKPSMERFGELPHSEAKTVRAIQQLLANKAPWTIPPNTSIRVVIDLDDYYCGFPHLKLKGQGCVTLEWAESLFHDETDYGKAQNKGNRDEVVGKIFHGFGDEFRHVGAPQCYRPYWWRAGRYWLLSIETGKHPLHIEQLTLEETRYPLERRDSFRSSQKAWDPIQPILWRGLQTGAHEIFTDSPYYEQMMYVGDTRLQALCHIVCGGDDRLVRRSLELFDWSRWRTGFIAERYPSDPYQLSLTFSTIWVGMLREYAWWRNDATFVRERLTGARCLLEHFIPLTDARGLLKRLPGWSFVDWVPTWERGIPPGERRDGSASVNLQFLLMLQALANLETAHGEPALARRVRTLAVSTGQAIVKAFWNDKRGLFADDTAHTSWSEHAQVLAILAGILPAKRPQLVTGLLTAPDLARCSIYFSHYWFEAMRVAGRGHEIVRKIDEWSQLPVQGFKTPPERLHDTRSDNHSWSSHPLFHLQATLTGVRPGSPGFKTVEITPLPGPLDDIDSIVPHPLGPIKTEIRFSARQCHGLIQLPAGLSGIFRWNGRTKPLHAGKNRIQFV
jgi:alpha-L-rhamnosidase